MEQHCLSLVENPLYKWGEKWAYFQAKIKLGPHRMEMMGPWERRNKTKPRKYIHSEVAGKDGPGVLGSYMQLPAQCLTHGKLSMNGRMDACEVHTYTEV